MAGLVSSASPRVRYCNIMLPIMHIMLNLMSERLPLSVSVSNKWFCLLIASRYASGCRLEYAEANFRIEPEVIIG